MFNNNAAQILIVVFFIITYFISVLEKITAWKNTTNYYSNHFKKTILHKLVPILLIHIVILEIIAFVVLALGLYYLITEASFLTAKIGLEISAIILIQFLAGQRLVKDYPGAMNITIYFILNIIGIYILT